jgi:RimJ/RimL family protein N-acetyltransferase
MVSSGGGVELREPLFSVECAEPSGKIVRHVRAAQLSLEKFKYYYEKLSQFDTLFNDYIKGDFQAFVECFLYQDAQGQIRPTGLIWDVDDVGILYLAEIKPGQSAQAHFTFWDRRLRGREKLIREACRHVMDELQLHRITVEIPLYATPTMKFVENNLGFKKEGRMREAVLYNGDWFDVNLYSILDHEV